MMKKLLLFLPVLLFHCGEDDDAIPQPPQPPACLEVVCETEDEFFGKAVMNGECWKADDLIWEGYGFTIELLKSRPDNINEGLYFSLHRNADLSDTIWLGSTNSGNPAPNIVFAHYSYHDLHGVFGGFNFAFGADLSYQDFLIIDYFNADTSILEGRFQVRFPQGSASPLVNAPDTMRLGCGSFRVQKQ